MSEQTKDALPWWRNDPWLGRHLFQKNREKNLHLLDGYREMHVAWFPDGSGIRDADPDPVALYERIKASGDDPAWYSYELVTDEPLV
jgi:hypothetical protein